MTTPAPRPALKRAADAHIHPAAPSAGSHLRAAPEPGAEAGSTAVPEPRPAAEAPVRPASRLSGPLGGTTSDALRAAGKRSRRSGRDAKRVELTVKVPKTLRKEFREALKAEQLDADEVVTTMLRVWLDR